MLSIAELAVEAGDLRVECSLEVEPGRCVALVGPSGAGKTTLLRAVAGLLAVAAGRVTCGGVIWSDGASVSLPPERRRCGYVFQDYALFGHLSVWRNVAYSLRGVRHGERRAAALRLLGRFGVAELADRRPATLSGGERQRVALARALALRPVALLLDEPLAALDVATRSHATRELASTIANAGAPAILVTHDFEEAATLADEIAVIDRGRIVQRGTPGEIAARPASAFAADLIGATVLLGRAKPDGEGTRIDLPSGAAIRSTDAGVVGDAAASVHPWDVVLEPAGTVATGSARNRLPARVATVTDFGGRIRIGLDAAGQALTAEVTPESVRELQLVPRREVVAVWKASATRVVER